MVVNTNEGMHENLFYEYHSDSSSIYFKWKHAIMHCTHWNYTVISRMTTTEVLYVY
jgi:hypothetical protein